MKKIISRGWIYLVMALIVVAMLFPFLNVIAVSITSYGDYLKNPMRVWPGELDFASYKHVINHALIGTSYRNTIITTVIGTLLSMALIVLTGYPLSHRELPGMSVVMKILLFTMMFNGGMIANFYLVRSLHIYNTLWALILPGSISAYNTILMKNYLNSMPASLEESAMIDGANDLTILIHIILPLSKPILATLALFCAVGRWNSFMNAGIYIKDTDKWTLQLRLREIVMNVRSTALDDPEASQGVALQNVKYAVIVVSILPIMCVYPFLQRFFVKGVMLGAVKG